jgi:hypothetical protein
MTTMKKGKQNKTTKKRRAGAPTSARAQLRGDARGLFFWVVVGGKYEGYVHEMTRARAQEEGARARV